MPGMELRDFCPLRGSEVCPKVNQAIEVKDEVISRPRDARMSESKAERGGAGSRSGAGRKVERQREK